MQRIYFCNNNRKKQNEEYPLIQGWQQELNQWFDEDEERAEKEQ